MRNAKIGWQSHLHGKMNLNVKGLKLDQPVATADPHACRYRLLGSTDKPGCLVVPAGLREALKKRLSFGHCPKVALTPSPSLWTPAR